DEGEDERRDVDLAGLQLLLEEQREQEVERSFEGIELELELANGRRQHGRRLAARPDASGAVNAPSGPPSSRPSRAWHRRASNASARRRRTQPRASSPHTPRR